MWSSVALAACSVLCLLFHLEMTSAAVPVWSRAVMLRTLGVNAQSPVEEQKDINTLAYQLCNRNYSFSILCVQKVNQTQSIPRNETQDRQLPTNLTLSSPATTLLSATGTLPTTAPTTSLPSTTRTQPSTPPTTSLPSTTRRPLPTPSNTSLTSSTGTQSPTSLVYSDLPQSYAPAFMTVDQLVNNANLTLPPGPNSGNTLVVFSNQTRRDFDADALKAVESILTAIVPGTYRTITYTNGCCPVLRFFAANETMKNINGVDKRLVHFTTASPPKYQFIQHGFCAQSSYSTNGHCIQGWVTMTLLVYDLDLYPPITFDIFNVPSFCNCVHY
ncbi:unnamed protein product [Lymnaea stagnalis]|uniref:Spaetzle domain-containing protein n=1 Tax=Lymnaea stagnalis TaxID=6523 RepID=A0AAV2HB22_LYMST